MRSGSWAHPNLGWSNTLTLPKGFDPDGAAGVATGVDSRFRLTRYRVIGAVDRPPRGASYPRIFDAVAARACGRAAIRLPGSRLGADGRGRFAATTFLSGVHPAETLVSREEVGRAGRPHICNRSR